MELIIDKLIVEEDRPAHIAKHKLTLKDVEEVLKGDYVCIRGKLNRWLLIGKTKKGKFLTVIVGLRKQKNVYGLVTARPADKEEQGIYREFSLLGGEENGQNN